MEREGRAYFQEVSIDHRGSYGRDLKAHTHFTAGEVVTRKEKRPLSLRQSIVPCFKKKTRKAGRVWFLVLFL